MQTRRPLAGAERAVLAILAAGVVVIPILYSSGIDVFRLPKELAFRAEAILLLAAAAFWATAPRRTWPLDAPVVIPSAIVAWTAVTTLTSTNRALSVDSLITVAAAAVIFIVTCVAARATSMIAVDVLMVGACANAAMAILQELEIWTPFRHDIANIGHYGSVGFVGNANDVGMLLAGPALAAFAVAVIASGRRRWIYAAVCALLAAGLVASATRTALGAFVVGLLLLGLRHSRRAAIAVAAIVIVFALAAISARTTLGDRVRELRKAAATRDYELLFSERLLPFLAAVDMVRDHPIVGVGPACFHYQFMRYRLALGERYPKEWTRGFPGNWGAVHNDHLQVAAETGVPGYLLFLGAMALAVRWRRGRETARPRGLETSFARAMRWPFAVLVFVLCLAQFPLQVAAPRLLLLTLGALCITWDDGDA